MTKQDNLKKKAMLEALEKTLGIVSAAVKIVGIARQTHYRWMDEDFEYKSSVLELDNIVLDFAESQLYTLIKNGEPSAVYFFLKTRGRKRGYSEREPENNVAMPAPVQIIIYKSVKLPIDEDGIE